MGVSRAVRTILLTCVIASVTAAAVPAVAVPTFSEKVIAGGPLLLPPKEANPEMDGRYIVYEYTPGFGDGVIDTDIKAYDVSRRTTIEITDRGGDDDVYQIRPDVSGDTVVYQSSQLFNRNVFLFNIKSSNTRQITNEMINAQTHPRISGRYVIWHDAGTSALKFYPTYWPQHMNQQIPGTVGVYQGSWDIDGDTVVFARKHVSGDVTFYKWTVWSDAGPEAFHTHPGAHDVAHIRLHNGRMTYTYGAGLNNVGVVLLQSGSTGPLGSGIRNADLFHEMYAFEIISGEDIGFKHNRVWETRLGTKTYAETNPSVFGNRVAFERDVSNGDIILVTSSEPLVDRTSGADRYATAVAASQEYFLAGADDVVLCTGENFPDALAAAPWARYVKGPVLLTRRTSVPQVVIDEIERLGAVKVWIVGGQSAVSSAVHAQLLGAGLDVNRELQGSDRYATSAKIARFLYDALIADGRPFSNMAFIARGDEFPDALAVAPVAAATYSPIILVQPKTPVPQPSAQIFKSLPIKYAFIVGDTGVVSEGVELAIEAWTSAKLGANSPARRWAGPDRYATAVAVLQGAESFDYVDLDTVGFATGANFPDALGGGAALGSYGSPLLLTGASSLPSPVAALLKQRSAEIGRADIFGGADVVSDTVRKSIVGLLK